MEHMTDPWDVRYIYLHWSHKNQLNVGKYTTYGSYGFQKCCKKRDVDNGWQCGYDSKYQTKHNEAQIWSYSFMLRNSWPPYLCGHFESQLIKAQAE